MVCLLCVANKFAVKKKSFIPFALRRPHETIYGRSATTKDPVKAAHEKKSSFSCQ